MREPLLINVQFDAGDDPITGSLTTGEGQLRFTGWLSLISELENAVGGWRQAGSGATDTPDAPARHNLAAGKGD